MYYTIESETAVMCAAKAIHALCQGHQPQKTGHKSLPHSAPVAPIHTLLAMTTSLHKMLSARAVVKKVTGMKSSTALGLTANNPSSPMELRRPMDH